MPSPIHLRRFLLGAVAVVASTALVACGSASDTSSTPAVASGAAESGSTATGDAITLNYWAWGTAQDGLVAAWNKAHPNIQVTHTDAGGGTDSSAKLLTAARAGEAPDVSVVEYQTLPAMIVGDVAADITEYVGDVKGAFTDSTWDLTTFNGAVYGVPQDVGPMALVYNQARFAELGITVPKTWAEFATAAEQVRKADPSTYIATFSPDEFGFFAGMSQQAGAKWWQVDGETWTVGIDDEASMEVADYWQDLVDRDLVKVENVLTPEYNKELNAGQMLSWPSALWAPGVIYGVAPEQAGQWAMAPLPQWTAGDAKVGYQGGSAVVVTTSSKHPKEAAEFAAWINSSQEGADIQLATGQYPASTLGQEAAVSSPPPVLMPQQTEFWQLASDIASDTVSGIVWGPNVNVASSAFQDAMSKAADNKTPFRDALTVTQQAVVDDMTKTGFQVSSD